MAAEETSPQSPQPATAEQLAAVDRGTEAFGRMADNRTARVAAEIGDIAAQIAVSDAQAYARAISGERTPGQPSTAVDLLVDALRGMGVQAETPAHVASVVASTITPANYPAYAEGERVGQQSVYGERPLSRDPSATTERPLRSLDAAVTVATEHPSLADHNVSQPGATRFGVTMGVLGRHPDGLPKAQAVLGERKSADAAALAALEAAEAAQGAGGSAVASGTSPSRPAWAPEPGDRRAFEPLPPRNPEDIVLRSEPLPADNRPSMDLNTDPRQGVAA